MTHGEALALAAAHFLGVRFCLHGRSRETGLDCLGLFGASLAAIGGRPCLPVGYQLRNRSCAPFLACAEKSGLEETRAPLAAGDILLSVPGPHQHHLMIAQSPACVIHAHAGLRKVVRQSLPCADQITLRWRLRADFKD